MKIFKSDDLSLLFRTWIKDGRCELLASVMAFFPLDADSEKPLLPGTEMWPALAEVLGEEPLDLGLPKKRGEFLVYGSAFSPKPVSSIQVRVKVGPKTKELTVTGHRYWKKAGWSASNPEPFSQMKICYANAYGGPDFPKNPMGKGRTEDQDGRRFLPNVQDPRKPVASQDDTPLPAGLTGYGFTWPQRTRFMGKVGPKYLVRDWPYFPKGTDEEFFNTAPEDQRLDGFFSGDEILEIHHMHPEKSVVQGSLPAIRPRLFINQVLDREEFREIKLHPETVWLFPDREQGIVLFRGRTACSDEEYEDVRHCLAEVETVAEPPKPLEHFREKFLILLDPNPEPSSEEAAPEPGPEPEPPVEAAAAAEPPLPREKTPEELEQAALLEKLEAFKEQAHEKIRKAGHDPEEYLQKIMPREEEDVILSPAELKQNLEKLTQMGQAMLAKAGLTKEEALKLAESQERKLPTPAEALEQLRASGVNKPELEQALGEMDLVYQAQQAQEAQKAEEEARKKELAGDEPKAPPGPKGPRDGAEALAWHRDGRSLAGWDLSGFDFSGLDLSGADFKKAILEGAVFSEADLMGAVFSEAVLLKADFSSASLIQALLNQVTAVEANFSKALLSQADLTEGDFSKADFTQADLTGARAGKATFEQALMENVKAVELCAERTMFETTHLAGADFSRADLTEAHLTGADISGAIFQEIRGQGLRLGGAQGEKANFQSAVLIESRANRATNLTNAGLSRADLSAGRWQGACLAGVDLKEARLDGGDFRKTDLSFACLTRASARKTDFMKADLKDAQLDRVNLLQGSLRKSDLVRTDLSGSNLYGVDFYKAKMSETKTKGANLNNTLLRLLS